MFPLKKIFVSKTKIEGPSLEELYEGVLAGDRSLLARAITLLKAMQTSIFKRHKNSCKSCYLILVIQFELGLQVFLVQEKVRLLKHLVCIYVI